MQEAQTKNDTAITFDHAVAVDKAVQRFGEFTAVNNLTFDVQSRHFTPCCTARKDKG